MMQDTSMMHDTRRLTMTHGSESRTGARRRTLSHAVAALALAFVTASALALLPGATAHAAAPDRFTFQGLINSDGEPLTGSVHLIFTLYSESSGGTSLWSQDYGDTPVTNGLYSVTLGPFPELAFDELYWLEVSVNGTALSPRYALHAVPYAMRAATADHAMNADMATITDHASIAEQAMTAYYAVTAATAETVAADGVDAAGVLDGSLTATDIGTNVVSSVAGVVNDGGDIALVAGENITITPDDGANTITIAAADPSGTAYDDRFVNENQPNSVTAEMIMPDVLSGISGVTNDGNSIALVAGENITITTDDDANAITIAATGSAGGGVTEVVGGSGLIATDESGPIVTLDVGQGRGIEVGNDLISVNAADFEGAGLTVDPEGDLNVNPGTGLELNGDLVQLGSPYSSGSAYDGRFVNAGEDAGGDLDQPYPNPTVIKLHGWPVSNDTPATDDVLKWMGTAWTPDDDGLKLPFSGTNATGDNGLYISNTGTADDSPAIVGRHDATDNLGIGVKGIGGDTGIHGLVNPTGDQTYYGVNGSVSGGIGHNFGVYGGAYGDDASHLYGVFGSASSTGPGTKYGVYGATSGSGTRYAGYFAGNVSVSGTLSKSAGSFRIDHPLDPLNKYLQHSFVESPDMMNVYNGNVVLDESGEATVTLPDWFGALNRDYRYQLTAVGAPGPNLYIAEKVNANRFRIAGGPPGLEVSWMVTGIRQDPFANENRIQVEMEKPDGERGKYFSPTAYGLPEESGIGYVPVRNESETSVQDAERR
jgi:hypothetical protein